MKPRRRRRLVEEGGVEAFELRVTLWFDADGKSYASLDVSNPDGPADPQLYEVLGVLEMAADIAKEHYA